MIDVVALRSIGPEGQPIWLISGETLDVVPKLLSGTDAPLIDRASPSMVTAPHLAGAPVAHWAVMAGLALLSLAVARAVALGIERGCRRIRPGFDNTPGGRLLHVAALPFGLFLSDVSALGTSAVISQWRVSGSS